MSYEQENHVDRNCECNSHQLNDTRVTETHYEWVDVFFFQNKNEKKNSSLSLYVCLSRSLSLIIFFPSFYHLLIGLQSYHWHARPIETYTHPTNHTYTLHCMHVRALNVCIYTKIIPRKACH